MEARPHITLEVTFQDTINGEDICLKGYFIFEVENHTITVRETSLPSKTKKELEEDDGLRGFKICTNVEGNEGVTKCLLCPCLLPKARSQQDLLDRKQQDARTIQCPCCMYGDLSKHSEYKDFQEQMVYSSETPVSQKDPRSPCRCDATKRDPTELSERIDKLLKETYELELELEKSCKEPSVPMEQIFQEAPKSKCTCGCALADAAKLPEQINRLPQPTYAALKSKCPCGCALADAAKLSEQIDRLSQPTYAAPKSKCPCGCALADTSKLSEQIDRLPQPTYAAPKSKCPCGCALADAAKLSEQIDRLPQPTYAAPESKCPCGCAHADAAKLPEQIGRLPQPTVAAPRSKCPCGGCARAFAAESPEQIDKLPEQTLMVPPGEKSYKQPTAPPLQEDPNQVACLCPECIEIVQGTSPTKIYPDDAQSKERLQLRDPIISTSLEEQILFRPNKSPTPDQSQQHPPKKQQSKQQVSGKQPSQQQTIMKQQSKQQIPGKQPTQQHTAVKQQSKQQIPGKQPSEQQTAVKQQSKQQIPGKQPSLHQTAMKQQSKQQIPGKQLPQQQTAVKQQSKQQIPGKQPSLHQTAMKQQSKQQIPGKQQQTPVKQPSKQQTPKEQQSQLQIAGKQQSKQQIPGKQPAQQLTPVKPQSKQQIPGNQPSQQLTPVKQQSKQQTPLKHQSKQQISRIQQSQQQALGKQQPKQQIPEKQPSQHQTPLKQQSRQHTPRKQQSQQQALGKQQSQQQTTRKYNKQQAPVNPPQVQPPPRKHQFIASPTQIKSSLINAQSQEIFTTPQQTVQPIPRYVHTPLRTPPETPQEADRAFIASPSQVESPQTSSRFQTLDSMLSTSAVEEQPSLELNRDPLTTSTPRQVTQPSFGRESQQTPLRTPPETPQEADRAFIASPTQIESPHTSASRPHCSCIECSYSREVRPVKKVNFADSEYNEPPSQLAEHHLDLHDINLSRPEQSIEVGEPISPPRDRREEAGQTEQTPTDQDIRESGRDLVDQTPRTFVVSSPQPETPPSAERGFMASSHQAEFDDLSSPTEFTEPLASSTPKRLSLETGEDELGPIQQIPELLGIFNQEDEESQESIEGNEQFQDLVLYDLIKEVYDLHKLNRQSDLEESKQGSFHEESEVGPLRSLKELENQRIDELNKYAETLYSSKYKKEEIDRFKNILEKDKTDSRIRSNVDHFLDDSNFHNYINKSLRDLQDERSDEQRAGKSPSENVGAGFPRNNSDSSKRKSSWIKRSSDFLRGSANSLKLKLGFHRSDNKARNEVNRRARLHFVSLPRDSTYTSGFLMYISNLFHELFIFISHLQY